VCAREAGGGSVVGCTKDNNCIQVYIVAVVVGCFVVRIALWLVQLQL
jgi:hypothetical protein